MSSKPDGFRSVTTFDSPLDFIGPLEPELLAAFNGFLLALVGVLLWREADFRKAGLSKGPPPMRVSPGDKFALGLLIGFGGIMLIWAAVRRPGR